MTIEKLKHFAAVGRMSRRDFIRNAVAAGLTVAAAEQLFVKVARAEPKKGGQFRIGLGSGATTDTLDPALWPDTFNGIFGWGSLGASLTEVQPDGTVIGDAAESVEPADGAKTWIFRLRKGAEFHNGKTLDADDVVATINYHRSEESKSAAKTLLEGIAELKADGKDVVVFTLKSGNADFPYYVADYHLPIVPAIITNMLAFIHLVADGEALMLARRAGLDLSRAWQAIAASSGTSFVHETEGQLILNGSYDIAFSMDLALKDLGFALNLGSEFGVPLELAALTNQTFVKGKAAYGGDAQSTQVVKLLEEVLNTDLRAAGFPSRLT